VQQDNETYRCLKIRDTLQVIQAVTFSSPIVGGHQQPFKRVTKNHPKKVTSRIDRLRIFVISVLEASGSPLIEFRPLKLI